MPEAAALIAGSLAASCRYDYDNETLVVTDAAGKPRVDANGKPMSAEALVSEFIDSRPFLRKATTPSGSGAEGSAGNKTEKSMLKSDWENMTPKEKAAHFDVGGTLRD